MQNTEKIHRLRKSIRLLRKLRLPLLVCLALCGWVVSRAHMSRRDVAAAPVQTPVSSLAKAQVDKQQNWPSNKQLVAPPATQDEQATTCSAEDAKQPESSRSDEGPSVVETSPDVETMDAPANGAETRATEGAPSNEESIDSADETANNADDEQAPDHNQDQEEEEAPGSQEPEPTSESTVDEGEAPATAQTEKRERLADQHERGEDRVDAEVKVQSEAPQVDDSTLVISNPARNKMRVGFRLNGRTIFLAPGQSQSFTWDAESESPPAWRFELHRGGDFGYADRLLRAGRHQFWVSDRGWRLKSQSPSNSDSEHPQPRPVPEADESQEAGSSARSS